jgi:MYXO-CTERM domain-containing protein
MGAPVYDGKLDEEALTAVITTGAPHVRVNFRLDRWTSPTDTTKHGGYTFFEAYDRIVDSIVSQGLEVYGLLNDELAGVRPKEAGFESAWVANALAVIDRYKDRVRTWETLNEPNDWDETRTARVPAETFASAHGRLYQAVKVEHAGDACWDVTLVSGPLFSFDDRPETNYLDAVIAAGRAGGRWRAVLDAIGRDPIDGVGYHVYVAQGPASTAADASAAAAANLNALRALLDARGLGDRRVWLSEIGFRASLVGDQGQADRLDAVFSSIGARNDVASIQWFSIKDFGADETWGLFASVPAGRRPAYDRFVARARALAPELAARLTIDLPRIAPPGARVVAKVTATNLGRSTWTASDGVRLGAASGCPWAWAKNDVPWDGAVDGYVKSVVDARRFLPAGAAVAQGESITIEVPLVVPDTPGKRRFAVRMVKDGVAWFGATATADLEVASGAEPPGGTGGERSGDERGEGAPSTRPPRSSGATGCGCRETAQPASNAGTGALAALLLAGLAWARRRR